MYAFLAAQTRFVLLPSSTGSAACKPLVGVKILLTLCIRITLPWIISVAPAITAAVMGPPRPIGGPSQPHSDRPNLGEGKKEKEVSVCSCYLCCVCVCVCVCVDVERETEPTTSPRIRQITGPLVLY